MGGAPWFKTRATVFGGADKNKKVSIIKKIGAGGLPRENFRKFVGAKREDKKHRAVVYDFKSPYSGVRRGNRYWEEVSRREIEKIKEGQMKRKSSSRSSLSGTQYSGKIDASVPCKHCEAHRVLIKADFPPVYRYHVYV